MNEDYFATETGTEEQLRMIGMEQVWDNITRRRIRALGIQPGWRCLEVGAGSGSIARWLQDEVGPQVNVVAADLDTRFLQDQEFEILELDIRNPEGLPAESFDLVHARAVLTHIPDPLGALRNMAAAVRPGGWLLPS